MTTSHDAAPDPDDASRRTTTRTDTVTRLELGDRVAEHLERLSPA